MNKNEKKLVTRRRRSKKISPNSTAGEQLSSYMSKAGMNQTKLAEAVGVSQSLISQLENDERLASADLAVKIEEAVGMPASVWRNEDLIGASRRRAKKWREAGVG